MTSSNYSSGFAGDAGDGARTGWGWILAYGLLVVLLGFLALMNPVVTGMATGLLLGAVLLVYGISAIASGLSSLSRRARCIEILLGILSILAAILTVFNPFASALSLALLIGAWLLVMGVFEIIGAFRSRHDRIWRLLLGILDAGLGALVLFSGPPTGLAFLALIVALSLLLRGTFLIILALGLRRIGKV